MKLSLQTKVILFEAAYCLFCGFASSIVSVINYHTAASLISMHIGIWSSLIFVVIAGASFSSKNSAY